MTMREALIAAVERAAEKHIRERGPGSTWEDVPYAAFVDAVLDELMKPSAPMVRDMVAATDFADGRTSRAMFKSAFKAAIMAAKEGK